MKIKEYLCPTCGHFLKFKGYTPNDVFELYKCEYCYDEFMHYAPKNTILNGGWRTAEGERLPRLYEYKGEVVIFT